MGDRMTGVNLDKFIEYRHASLRFFEAGERHVSRLCIDDVLLLVYDGILRFSEDGEQFEVGPGEYHIQRHNTVQTGEIASSAPKYFYVHFLADWSEGTSMLPVRGIFDYVKMKTIIEELDALEHSHAPYIAKAGKFYEILTQLRQSKAGDSVAHRMADSIARQCSGNLTLEKLCDEFHFSKNHLINLFKKEFDVTPIVYMNGLRLQKAEQLMEVTSNSLEDIALKSGFQNYSHFYKLFHRKHGMSPEQWRLKRRIG